MKKGFTLLELIVVIIIIGILATLGFTQYTRMIEKGRTAEARANLGVLRQRQIGYLQEFGEYAQVDGADDVLSTGLPVDHGCSSQFYFWYECAGAGDDTCTATRCIDGENGKTPPGDTDYTITIDIDDGTITDPNY